MCKSDINTYADLFENLDDYENRNKKCPNGWTLLKDISDNSMFNDWNNKDECVEHLENELKYAYKNGFTTELISNVESDANNLSFGIVDEKINDNFHNYAKQLVDKYSMNKKGNTYNA